MVPEPEGDGAVTPGVGTAVTFRAAAIGVITSALIGMAYPYAEFVIRGTRPSNTALPFGAIVFFFAVVAGLNPLIASARRRLALTRGELTVIFVMILVASAVPTWGLVGQLLPILAGASYFASPANRWGDLILPQVPSWVAPTDDLVCKHFYEGLPPGQFIPWGAWAVPLAAWAVFVASLYATTFGLMLLVRRRWIVQERLVFPLMRLPLELIGAEAGPSLWPELFRSRALWLGFLLTLLSTSLLALNHYFPAVPLLKLHNEVYLPLDRERVLLRLWLNPSVVSFNYLLSSDLAFSLWFFALVTAVQTPLWRLWGISLGAAEIYGAGNPAISCQAFGAMAMLVAAGLYQARHEVARTLRAAFQGGEYAGEPCHARVVVGCLVGGLGGMLIWLRLAGLDWVPGIVFLASAFTTFLALTRATVQGGVPVSRAAQIPQYFVSSALGGRNINAVGTVALGYTFVWAADIRVIMMPFVSHSLKLWDGLENPRGFLPVVSAAIAVPALISAAYLLRAAYVHSGLRLGGWLFGGCPKAAFTYVAQQLNSPAEPSVGRWLWMGAGAVVMWALTALHTSLTWWPLHPLGFAIAPTQPVQDLWFSGLWGWLAKVVVMRYAGFRGYSTGVHFFMGAILGQFLGSGAWLVIDALTGSTGNMLYVY